MMKKLVLICMILLFTASAGCSAKPNEESSQNVSEVSIESSEEISVKKDIGEFLENTFVNLWKSDTVYIDVKMTVEENEKDTEESKGNGKSIYRYVIAADKKQNFGMLNMEQSNGTKVHYVISRDKIYDIDDEERSYELIKYKDTIEDFIKAYTKDMNLGVSESIKLSESGTTKFDGKENIEFEKYDVSMSDNTSSKITITYYFKDKEPYAEVMQSDRGKTTFMFQSVSDKIPNEEIFKISPDYSEITE